MGFFCKWFLVKNAEKVVPDIFSYFLSFSRKKGLKGPNMLYLGVHKTFIIYPILTGFFSFDSSQWELS